MADGEDRVEGRCRLLEDHRDPPAAQVAERARAHVQDFVALYLDAAGPARAMLGVEPQDRAQGDALARARFAQDAQGLAALEVEADAVHGVDGAIRRLEGDVQVADLQEVARAVAALEWPEPATLMWQATDCCPASASAGSSLAQTSSANGQRVRNRQPDGGSM